MYVLNNAFEYLPSIPTTTAFIAGGVGVDIFNNGLDRYATIAKALINPCQKMFEKLCEHKTAFVLSGILLTAASVAVVFFASEEPSRVLSFAEEFCLSQDGVWTTTGPISYSGASGYCSFGGPCIGECGVALSPGRVTKRNIRDPEDSDSCSLSSVVFSSSFVTADITADHTYLTT